MDELELEGETYFSTKRAAKETGYAKDYVGQLCREGRVTARLVGRSWYVLASAIREHRFGGVAQDVAKVDTKNEPLSPQVTEPIARELPSLAWEPARYEPMSDTPLPNINRLHDVPVEAVAPERTHVSEIDAPAAATSDMQSVWSEWFENRPVEAQSTVTHEARAVTVVEPAEAAALSEEASLKGDVGGMAVEDDPTIIPLRPIVSTRTLTPVPATADNWSVEERAETLAVQRSRERAEVLHRDARAVPPYGGFALRVLAVTSVLFAVIFLSLAVIGTGYIDSYLISFKQVSYVSGFYHLKK